MNYHNILRQSLTGLLTAVYSFMSAAVTSPSGSITVDFEKGDGLTVGFLRDGRQQRVLTLGCDVDSFVSVGKAEKVSYDMPTGKRSRCANSFVPVDYRLSDGSLLAVRVYNDGVAWKSACDSQIDVSDADHWWLQSWKDCYEEFFPKDRSVSEDERMAYPALFEYPGGLFALITESGVGRESAASSLYGGQGAGQFTVRSDGEGERGWQTAIIGTLSDVVESTLVTDNSAPAPRGDMSWVQPGVASWVYWAYNHGSSDYEIVRKYIDFAAELSLPYVLIDAEWDEMKGDKTVDDAIAYALERGVKPMIWYNSSVGWINGAPGPKFRLNSPEDREKEFAWCEKAGVAGVKIDFFSGDTNMNLRYMVELLEAAAAHRLLVNFHGVTLPRGWQRTYPNFITSEAVYGAEWYNNVPTFTEKAAAHNATLPFTRNVVGSMDYTPCAFSDSQHPHITTKGHELALTVMYESGIQHIADRPESILSQPARVRELFTTLPAAWDDTVLLGGYPGEYAVMARRKGGVWYISGINGSDSPREVALDMERLSLPAAGTSVSLLTDATDAGNNGWLISDLDSVPENLKMKPRGGFVMIIK